MGNKIVLDTNVLYVWASISFDPMLSIKDLDMLAEEHKLFITTIFLLEVIIKNREDILSIRKCLSFIFDRNLKIDGVCNLIH